MTTHFIGFKVDIFLFIIHTCVSDFLTVFFCLRYFPILHKVCFIKKIMFLCSFYLQNFYYFKNIFNKKCVYLLFSKICRNLVFSFFSVAFASFL